MAAYYSEKDPFSAAWLRVLIEKNIIAPGEVDERDIKLVTAEDLRGFVQCHFFAGIGVWSYALRQAGWPDDFPVWTGSCPCQPFSISGRKQGFDDERHLWPNWFDLIKQCRPAIIFGEQVGNAIGKGLQKVQGSEGYIGFREQWEERMALDLQNMYAGESPEEQESGSEIWDRLSTQASCPGLDSSRENESREEKASVRSGSAHLGNPGKDRSGDVRSDWSEIRSGSRQDLGQPVTGSNNSTERIHLFEYSSGMPCGEQRDGRLGRAENCGHVHGNIGEAQECFQRLIEGACGKIEADDRETWLGLVRSDLGRINYTFGACSTPAAGFGAPHRRQRLYWVGESNSAGWESRRKTFQAMGHGRSAITAGGIDGLADAEHSERRPEHKKHRDAHGRNGFGRRSPTGIVGADGLHSQARLEGHVGDGNNGNEPGRLDQIPPGSIAAASFVNGFWRNAEWVPCSDGKARPIEPGVKPLAYGASGRVGRLRGYGNALVAAQAQAFIEAYIAERFK